MVHFIDIQVEDKQQVFMVQDEVHNNFYVNFCHIKRIINNIQIVVKISLNFIYPQVNKVVVGKVLVLDVLDDL